MPTDIIELPRDLWRAAGVRFNPRPSSLTSQSALSGLRSVYGPNVHLWRAEIATPPLTETRWRELEAIFFALGGVAGRIRLGNPLKTRPYLNIVGTPTNEGFTDATEFTDGTEFASGPLPATAYAAEAADAESDSLVIGGLPPSLSPCLWMADCLEVRPNGTPAEHGHYYAVTRQAPTDANGMTRVQITPPLRVGVAQGDQIVLDHPMSVFRAVDDEQGIMSFQRGRIGQTGFTLLEDIEW